MREDEWGYNRLESKSMDKRSWAERKWKDTMSKSEKERKTCQNNRVLKC